MVALDKLALSIIVFFVFIIGGALYISDVETSYADDDVDMEIDVYINETFKTATNNPIEKRGNASLSSDTYDLSKDMQGRMFGKEVDVEDTESSMFSGSFSVIRLITSPIRLINSVINQVGEQIPIPPVFLQYGFAALIISIMFGVIYLIFRVKS